MDSGCGWIFIKWGELSLDDSSEAVEKKLPPETQLFINNINVIVRKQKIPLHLHSKKQKQSTLS